jgi:8-oxo-dGTP pyrophosphatase MutT (NUDIX family)
MGDAAPLGYEIIGDERIGAGGFLVLRRLRLRLLRPDGTRSQEGLYDVVVRPIGADAVVVVLFHRQADGRVQVLLRTGPRVPLAFGRPGTSVGNPGAGPPVPLARCTELVAGILEAGEERDQAAIFGRAATEAYEEAGLTLSPDAFFPLGSPLYPTPGMCDERFCFVAGEVHDPHGAIEPMGDGSPFEEGAELRWVELEGALASCRLGEIADMKTELALGRLRDHLAGVG